MTNFKKFHVFLSILCIFYMCCVSFLQFSLRNDRTAQTAELVLLMNTRNIHSQQLLGNWSVKKSTLPHSTLIPLNPASSFRPKANTFTFYNDMHFYTAGTTYKVPGDRIYPTTVTKSVLLQKLRTQKRQNYLQNRPELTNTAHGDYKNIFDTDRIMPIETSVEFLTLGDSVYVFGAFLDERYAPKIYARIFILQPHLDSYKRLLCRFSDLPNKNYATEAEAYEMCENHGKKYGGWIYSCLTRDTNKDTTPKSVSLILLSQNGTELSSLYSVHLEPIKSKQYRNSQTSKIQHAQKTNSSNKVKWRKKKDSTNYLHNHSTNISELINMVGRNNKEKVGVCVPPLYGDVYLSKLISFIEMCRLLGANQLFFYIQDISLDIFAFLRHYRGTNSSILSLVNWNLPIIRNSWSSALSPSQIIWNRGQLLAVQHCMYTNMANYDWLLFIDIDEMLVPKTANSWSELIAQTVDQHYEKLHTGLTAAISFESAFFQQDFQTQVTNSIHYFQYIHRTRNTSVHRSKLLVRPLMVFEMGIHHVSKAVSEDLIIIKAQPTLGLIHHYRKCQSEDGMNDIQCDILEKDETIGRYEGLLTLATRARVKDAMDYFASVSQNFTARDRISNTSIN